MRAIEWLDELSKHPWLTEKLNVWGKSERAQHRVEAEVELKTD